MSNSWLGSYGLTSSDGLPSPTQPYPELQAEYTYLLNTLSVENHKATILLLRIPALEHFLLGDGAASLKRKTRKQLGWLKHRFEEASRQERIILLRLGQLTWELQQMERLRNLEEKRRVLRQVSWNPAKFNPTVPEFCPQMDQLPQHTWHASGVQWQNVQWQQPYTPVSEEYTHGWSPMNARENQQEAIPRDIAPELGIYSIDNATEASGQTDEVSETNSSKRKTAPRPRSSSIDGSSKSSAPQVRRKSLPSLSDWTGKEAFGKPTEDEEEALNFEEEEEKEAKTVRLQRDSGYEEYLGFYVKV